MSPDTLLDENTPQKKQNNLNIRHVASSVILSNESKKVGPFLCTTEFHLGIRTIH